VTTFQHVTLEITNHGSENIKCLHFVPYISVVFDKCILCQNILQNKKKTVKYKYVTNEDIHWVITVPAIWDLKAKQFMKDAAEKVNYIIYQD
jgi:hypothetical protein